MSSIGSEKKEVEGAAIFVIKWLNPASEHEPRISCSQ